ncbi:CpsD/CapB family tyrosine-protein kinase [bacterium AH-315-J21]|nr:CpsD/CapB family tyrosine-protein kinase [bacterium AH-315-J21]
MKRENNAISIVDRFDLESNAATEFRRLIHNLNGAYAAKAKQASARGSSGSGLRSSSTDRKSILITSATVSEGKSTTTAFLGICSAKLKERRTLLIDCDLRRPSMHHLFSIEREQGLSEYLTEGLSGTRIIKKTELDRLDIITAGKHIDNPTEVFDASRIGRLIDEVADQYDFIILDSPPVLPVSDPMLLAEEVDGVLLVVKAGETQRDVVVRARDLLTGSTDRLLGVVLNNLNNSLPYYFNPNYYRYETTKD